MLPVLPPSFPTRRSSYLADVVAGLQRRGGIRAVIAENVAAVLDFVFAAQLQQAAGQVAVERPARILHRDGDAVFAGILARRDGAVVDRHQLDRKSTRLNSSH